MSPDERISFVTPEGRIDVDAYVAWLNAGDPDCSHRHGRYYALAGDHEDHLLRVCSDCLAVLWDTWRCTSRTVRGDRCQLPVLTLDLCRRHYFARPRLAVVGGAS